MILPGNIDISVCKKIEASPDIITVKQWCSQNWFSVYCSSPFRANI